MTRPKVNTVLVGNIEPDQIYRTTLYESLFGYGEQATNDKIKSGELPMPFPLSEGGRARAWTGRQILEHRARMQELAAEKAEADRAAAKKRAPSPQPAALAANQKTRKIKLRPPVAKQRERQSA
jgi:hypothetical protein